MAFDHAAEPLGFGYDVLAFGFGEGFHLLGREIWYKFIVLTPLGTIYDLEV